VKNGIRLKIAPSILSADFGRLAEQVKAAEEGGADCIHIDVMDGRFVPNISVGPLVVRAVHRVTTLPLYVHLMIVEPESYISQFAEAGADLVEVHQETCPHLYRTVQQIKSSGASAGVAINPATPASSLEEILQYVDSVLVMTVEPGFGGQEFILSRLGKIRQVRNMLAERGLGADVVVDGGINTETAPLVVAAGANVLVAGHAIYGVDMSVEEAISQLRASAEHGPSVLETARKPMSA